MSYFLVKPTLLIEGKNVKKQFVVKAESSILAEATTVLNLAGQEIVEIPDINKKQWVEIIPNELGGDFYEVKIEWDNVDEKTVKESYLVQEFSTKASEDIISNLQKCEVVGTSKTNIVDYFIQEEEV